MSLQMSETDQKAIRELYSAIKNEFKVTKILLFGSRARGDADAYSDIDLLVLTEKPRDIKDRYKLSDIAADINIDYGVAISCLYMNEQDWEQELDINPLLKKNIQEEGIELVLQ
ncbi:nucleotidyltransferase domain-containing protein [Shimazuella sp. AN120528]|uniref:nucleotidyltransferase domain-containing protein n=1 Tax=Shimazuella soli TaxID=1892854 RepID=UPI001F0D4F01|nr:nucleotidyltransferase domain-containing protein [Shimazuella soli]MCH5583721.1 nucleotidyltransferase domain-containing protein [Shimazuella soli]